MKLENINPLKYNTVIIKKKIVGAIISAFLLEIFEYKNTKLKKINKNTIFLSFQIPILVEYNNLQQKLLNLLLFLKISHFH